MEMPIDAVYCFFMIINELTSSVRNTYIKTLLFSPCKLKVTIALYSLASGDVKHGLII